MRSTVGISLLCAQAVAEGQGGGGCQAQGLVVLRRDYWDTAEELYEKLPVLGRLMRWLRRQMTTP